MATHDYVLANQSGSAFRSDLNNALSAIVSQNSSSTEPATKYSYQYWIDTSPTPALIKQRNAANDAWITLGEVDGQTLAADGTDAKPGIAFASDINSGLKRNGSDSISIVTGGVQGLTVDGSGNVGIGQTSIAVNLEIKDDSPKLRLVDSDTALSDNEVSSTIEFFQSDASGTGVNASIVAKGDGSTGNLALCFNAFDDTEKMRIQGSDVQVHGNLQNHSAPASGTAGYFLADAGISKISRVAGNSSTVFQVFGTNGEFRTKGDGDCQNTNNNYGAISDSKLKENIADAASQWDDIKAVQVRKYNFKEETGFSTHTQLGVVAQELETVCPGLVEDIPDEDVDGNALETTTKAVSYSVLYMKAVKALQEAMERIETLETKVAALEAAN